MVIDMRTRLPHGHLANQAADMRFHAQRLSQCAQELRSLLVQIENLNVPNFVRELQPAD